MNSNDHILLLLEEDRKLLKSLKYVEAPFKWYDQKIINSKDPGILNYFLRMGTGLVNRVSDIKNAKFAVPAILTPIIYKKLPYHYQQSLINEFKSLHPKVEKILEKIQWNGFTAPIYLIGAVFISHKLYIYAKEWFNFLKSKKAEMIEVAKKHNDDNNENLDHYNNNDQ